MKARINLNNNVILNTRLSQFDDQYNSVGQAAFPSILKASNKKLTLIFNGNLHFITNILAGIEYNDTTAKKNCGLHRRQYI